MFFIKFHNLGGLVDDDDDIYSSTSFNNKVTYVHKNEQVEQMNIGLFTPWYNVSFTNDYVNL